MYRDAKRQKQAVKAAGRCKEKVWASAGRCKMISADRCKDAIVKTLPPKRCDQDQGDFAKAFLLRFFR